MPKFLENKLKSEYGQNSSVPYKIMNAMGAMRGNKETAKGRAMQKKHEADTETGGYYAKPKRGRPKAAYKAY